MADQDGEQVAGPLQPDAGLVDRHPLQPGDAGQLARPAPRRGPGRARLAPRGEGRAGAAAGGEEAVEQARRYSAASARSGMAFAASSSRLRKPARCSGVAGGRRPRPAGRRARPTAAWPRPAPPGRRRGPPLATRVSGSSPPAMVASRRLRSGASSGSASSAERPGRLGTGRVAVEAEHRLGRDLPQRLQLLGRQRGAERRHRAGEAGLVQGDDIHVALDHHHRAAAEGPLPRQVEAVEAAALGEQLGLRAVDVFRLAVAEDAAAEADGPAAPVADREDHPVEEHVDHAGLRPVRVARLHQPGGDELLGRDPLALEVGGQRPAALAGPAQAEAGDGRLAQARGGAGRPAPPAPPAAPGGGGRRPRPRRRRHTGPSPGAPARPPGASPSAPRARPRRPAAPPPRGRRRPRSA